MLATHKALLFQPSQIPLDRRDTEADTPSELANGQEVRDSQMTANLISSLFDR